MLEELVGGSVAVHYTYGEGLISQLRGGVKHYYHTDGQGSTRNLTDSNGIQSDNYTYDAFGNILQSNGTTPNSYLFAGQQFDAMSQLYYLRARYYQPSSGRFLALDPVPGEMSTPVTLNKYVYAANDPVNKCDPSGQFLCISTRAWGTIVHQEIGNHFTATGINRLADRTINTILGVSVPGGAKRPDLVDLGSQEVYEIKPVLSAPLGVVQLWGYLNTLNTYDPMGRSWSGGWSYFPPPIVNIQAPFVFATVQPPIAGLIVYCAIDTRPIIALLFIALLIRIPVLIPAMAFAF